MPDVATPQTPLKQTLRTHLHEALDELLDADGDALSVPEAAAADQAFVTLLRLARARATKVGGVR
jgi:hypothetical protein